MKPLFLLLPILLLASCRLAPSVRVAVNGDTTIVGGVTVGVKNTSEASSVKVKMLNGTTIETKQMIAGEDQTAIPNAAIGAGVTTHLADDALGSLKSTNHLGAVKARQPTIQAGQKPTILKSTAPDGTVSESAVFPSHLPAPKPPKL